MYVGAALFLYALCMHLWIIYILYSTVHILELFMYEATSREICLALSGLTRTAEEWEVALKVKYRQTASIGTEM